MELRELFINACQMASFTASQIKDLEKKIVENSLKSAVTGMYEVLGKKINKNEAESLKTEFEAEKKLTGKSYSSEQKIELVKRIFNRYLKQAEIDGITKTAFDEKFRITAKTISDHLDQKDQQVQALRKQLEQA